MSVVVPIEEPAGVWDPAEYVSLALYDTSRETWAGQEGYHFSANSEYKDSWSAYKARMDQQNKPDAWCALPNNDGELTLQWGKLKDVFEVTTKGSKDRKSWIDYYYLECLDESTSGDDIMINSDNSGRTLFTGNTNADSVVSHKFDTPIRCAGIKLIANRTDQPKSRQNKLCTKLEVKFYTDS